MEDINYLNFNARNNNRIGNRKNKQVRNSASYRAYRSDIHKRDEFVLNDKKKNKTGMVVGTVASIIAAAIIFLGAVCWHKGRSANNADKKFFEHIKDGWKELWKKSDKPKKSAPIEKKKENVSAIQSESPAPKKKPANTKSNSLEIASTTVPVDKEAVTEKPNIQEIIEELNSQEKNKTKQNSVSKLFSRPKLVKVDKTEYPKNETDLFGITRIEKIVTNAKGHEYILKENYKDGVITNAWCSEYGKPDIPHFYMEFRNGKMVFLTKYKKGRKDLINEFDSEGNLTRTTLFKKRGSCALEVIFYDTDTHKIKTKEYYNRSNIKTKEISLDETTGTIKETFFCKDGFNIDFENILTSEGEFISQHNITNSIKGQFVKMLKQFNI